MGYLSNAGLSYFFGKLKTIFAPISHGHGGATQSAAGFMSVADKKKLDEIAEGANKYSLPTATSNVLGGVKTGANITNSNGVLSVTAANVTNALGYTPPKQDTNTWRPVVNSLTSSAADQSLAANQGKILNKSKAAMIVLTNENLNDVVTPGFYSSGGSNSVTNKPSNVDHFGLIVIHRASGSYYTQIVYSDSAAYRRHCVDGTWSGWVQDKLTDTDTWRGIQNNLTSDSTTDSLSAAQGKALKTLVDGKAASGHTHKSVIDNGDGTNETTFAYSKAGMNYGDYTWLAGWNGYELRAINKNQFAQTSHTHDDRYYTETEMDTKLAAKSNTSHTHDDRYYTETETNSLLSGKLTTKVISTALDMDTLTTTGVYHLTGTLTNSPESSHAMVIVNFDIGTPFQIFIHDMNNVFYKRNYSMSSKTWSSWTKLSAGYADSAGSANSAVNLDGFKARMTSATWGNQVGTVITGWDDDAGGSVVFRKNNPSNGKMSMIIDGCFYQSEGQYMVLDTSNYSDYAATKNHTHAYLPLAGGTVTGVTAFTNTTASTSKTTGAVKVSGGVGVAGRMSANEVMIGDGCTLRYDATNKCVNFTFS